MPEVGKVKSFGVTTARVVKFEPLHSKVIHSHKECLQGLKRYCFIEKNI